MYEYSGALILYICMYVCICVHLHTYVCIRVHLHTYNIYMYGGVLIYIVRIGGLYILPSTTNFGSTHVCTYVPATCMYPW